MSHSTPLPIALSVVIVDDYDINLTLFKALVSRIPGLEPLCFKVSAQGLAWCEENGADVVIVDYMMPAPDGIEFIRRFRKIPGMLDVPVVMVTANTLTAVRHEALQAGATDFLTKPIDKDEFIARVTNMAALRRGQKLLANRADWLASEVEKATATIVERELDTIVRLTKAAEYRDQETGGHIERMAHYSRQIAAAGGTVDFVAAYERGAPQFDADQQALARQAATDGSVWLLSSSEAVAHLAAALPGQHWGQARALATHPRIAQAAQAAGFGSVNECRPAFNEVAASIESLHEH